MMECYYSIGFVGIYVVVFLGLGISVDRSLSISSSECGIEWLLDRCDSHMIAYIHVVYRSNSSNIQFASVSVFNK